MAEIHCHSCGGFIDNPVTVSYRLPVAGTETASPHAALCGCTPAIVYGAPPGWMSRGANFFATHN